MIDTDTAAIPSVLGCYSEIVCFSFLFYYWSWKALFKKAVHRRNHSFLSEREDTTDRLPAYLMHLMFTPENALNCVLHL